MKLLTADTFPSIVKEFDTILTRGLCKGVGSRDGQMCIEAAICTVLDLPHGDNPTCVAEAVRQYKIRLNDSNWSSPQARAAGLRNLGIAQLGSKGVVSDAKFSQRLALRTIQRLIPPLFKQVWPKGEMAAHVAAMEAATDLVQAKKAVGGAKADAAAYAAAAADAAYAYAAADAAYAYAAAYAAAAADAAAAVENDHYLLLSAQLAYEVLVELQSPGAVWLEAQKAEVRS